MCVGGVCWHGLERGALWESLPLGLSWEEPPPHVGGGRGWKHADNTDNTAWWQ